MNPLIHEVLYIRGEFEWPISESFYVTKDQELYTLNIKIIEFMNVWVTILDIRDLRYFIPWVLAPLGAQKILEDLWVLILRVLTFQLLGFLSSLFKIIVFTDLFCYKYTIEFIYSMRYVILTQ